MPPYKHERNSSAKKEEELDENTKLTTQLFSYFRLPFLISFYLLISPFHLEFIDAENFHLHTCVTQKILWVVSNIINICVCFAEIGLYWRKTHAEREGDHTYATLKLNQMLPDVYDLIDTVCLTVHLCSVYLFLWVTWKKRLKLAKSLELLMDAAQKLGICSQHVLCKRTVLIITLLTFLKPIYHILGCLEAAGGDLKMTFWLAINESIILRIDPALPIEPYAFTAIFLYIQLNFFNFTDAICLLSVLLIGLYVDAFLEKLESGKLTAYQIFHLYNVLKQASRAINKITEIIFIGFLVGSATYYPYAFLKLAESDLYSARLFTFINLIYHCVVWGYAAHLNGKMKKMDKWLSLNYLALKPHDLQMLIYYMGKNEIGIHPFKSILINYGFCRSLTAIVLTYAIILVQFRKPPII